jgi:DNA methylase
MTTGPAAFTIHPMNIQPSLFPGPSVDSEFDRNLERNRFRMAEVDIGDVTFLAGQAESVHRWYRLTPSYSPGLVRFFIREFGIRNDSLVLDPFSGRGTTVIECQKQGIRAVGFEINPLLQRVGSYSLTWGKHPKSLFDQFLASALSMIKKRRESSVEEVSRDLATPIPDIHDVFRWWKPEVLRDLIIAKACAREKRFQPLERVLWLAITETSLACANIHRNHPTITFDDGHDRVIDVHAELRRELLEIAEDVSALTPEQISWSDRSEVRLEDSCSPSSPLAVVTHVITSPPYPNRYSYVHQTRPQLHFMDILETRRCATDIDLKTVGGTWGAATSMLTKSLIVPPEAVRPALSYWDALSRESVLMCNYATKYFLDLERHLRSLRPMLVPGARCAYVVGNSRLSGVEIYTETILARLFQLTGFEVEKIILFRKRGGRKRLYETAVVARV